MGASVDAGEWEGREETEIEFAMFKSTPADGDEHKNHSDHWRKENEITGPAWGEKSGLIGSRGRDPSAAKLKAFRSRDRTPPFAKPMLILELSIEAKEGPAAPSRLITSSLAKVIYGTTSVTFALAVVRLRGCWYM